MKKFTLLLVAALIAFASCDTLDKNANNDGNIDVPVTPDKPHKPGENLNDPDIPGVKNVTVAEFLRAESSTTQRYKLKGIITEITNSDFGDFYLKDDTGTVYVYGLTSTDRIGLGKKANNQSFSSLGLNKGDFVIIVGLRDYYKDSKDKDQVGGPAYYIAHDPSQKPDQGGQEGGNEGGQEGGNEGESIDPVDPSLHSGAGWFELPVVCDKDHNGIDDNDKSLYYAFHMCAGGEKYANGNKARNFSVCYSAKHHCPVWVAAPVHKFYKGSANRTNAYGPDPVIPRDIQYKSKSTGGGCNKGHMLGSSERLSSSATNRQVFYWTNIAPQNSSTFNLGGGAWNSWEDKIDSYVCSDTLYQVIGCYFEEFEGNQPKTITYGGRNDVTRPTMFYNVLLRTKNGSTGKAVTACSPDELKCVAIVVNHAAPKSQKPSRKDLRSVSDLEKLTGFTYFPNVPNAPKKTFNPSDWGL